MPTGRLLPSEPSAGYRSADWHPLSGSGPRSISDLVKQSQWGRWVCLGWLLALAGDGPRSVLPSAGLAHVSARAPCVGWKSSRACTGRVPLASGPQCRYVGWVSGGRIAVVAPVLTFWALTHLQALPPANKRRHLLLGEMDGQPWAAEQKQFSQACDWLTP